MGKCVGFGGALQQEEHCKFINGPKLPRVHLGVPDDHGITELDEGIQAFDALLLHHEIRLVYAGLVQETS